MGFIFDEKSFINDNVFLHEEKINSQYTRFLESTPTYVTYYSINNIESTADSGFLGVERVLGPQSPLRFNEVKDLPVYGIEQIILNLGDELQGLDSSYEGEGIILPNTINPLPNDLFTISYLNQNYIFMVTEISYDTIKSNNFFKISFTIKSLDEEQKGYLDNQLSDKFNCIVDNIGSKERVIIRQDDIQQLLKLNEIYTNIAQYYKLLFFSNKYNSFLCPQDDVKLYDKYLGEFINKFGLFNEKKKYETMILTNEDPTPTMLHEYHKSFYRAVEKKDKKAIKPSTYSTLYLTSKESIFSYHRDSSVRSIQLGNGPYEYVRQDFLDKILYVPDEIDENILCVTIMNYFNDITDSIYQIDMNGLEDYMDFMEPSQETYVLVPVLLYVLRYYYNKFMTTT